MAVREFCVSGFAADQINAGCERLPAILEWDAGIVQKDGSNCRCTCA